MAELTTHNIMDQYSRECQLYDVPCRKEYESLPDGYFRAFVYPPSSVSSTSFCGVGHGKKAALHSALAAWKTPAALGDVLYTVTSNDDGDVLTIRPLDVFGASPAADRTTVMNVSNCGPNEYITVGILLNSDVRLNIETYECHDQLTLFKTLRSMADKAKCAITFHIWFAPRDPSAVAIHCNMGEVMSIPCRACQKHIDTVALLNQRLSQERARNAALVTYIEGNTIESVDEDAPCVTHVDIGGGGHEFFSDSDTCSDEYADDSFCTDEDDVEADNAYGHFGGHCAP